MRVFPANCTGLRVGWLAGKTDRIGLLLSPGGERSPYFLPYALDNGRFPAWASGKQWSESAWRKLLAFADGLPTRPLWCLVPDVVANAKATRSEFDKWAPELVDRYPLAYAVQDGSTWRDVPPEASVVFVGGSTRWKWNTVRYWTSFFDRVHVGRVNSPNKLQYLARNGVESCDGTGWFRGRRAQFDGLESWLLSGSSSGST